MRGGLAVLRRLDSKSWAQATPPLSAPAPTARRVHCVGHYKWRGDDVERVGGRAQVTSCALASLDFGVLGGSWNPSPVDTEGRLCICLF